ncbi:spindle assembly abnormal protein 6 homolog [Amphibalanus amphitrite]|uniref:spindle assembly abnormal protein 6 homolog n=1 Tax=Amphibalanus amphitrite TaxID=1232801 RepID=UPI001C913661|nr:spindle assembly abnormal protein 6 homolog [Amphibalanus amphitrite]XP_043204739.1 spindle assembly abnormal protein 6 homolog [Amphibalanus amphitrite]
MDSVQTLRCPVLHKHGPDQQQQRSDITIQIDQSAMVNTPSKTLKIMLTSDEDPFFHYVLTLREDSFSQLRSAQGLLVDFAQFPRKFTELVEQCVGEATGSESPRFSLHVDTAGCGERQALLEVVEVNPFRHLSHIALRLAAASDSDLKLYLAKTIKTIKEELQSERERRSSAEQSHTSQLRHTQELLAQRSSQLEQLRAELQQLSTTSSSQLQQQLAAERDKARQAQWEEQQKQQAERQRLVEQHRQQTQQLEQRAETLDRQCRQLTETKYKQEVRCREVESQLKSLETEHRQLKQEVAALRRQNASLDEEYHGKSKSVQQLRTRVAVLETEVRDQQQLLQRQEQLQQAAQQSKERLESQVTELQSTLTRREKTVKTVSQDLLKANDIIRKLQAETKAHHAKLKLRSQIAVEQERLLTEAAEQRQQLEQQLRETSERQTAAAAHSDRLQTEVAELQAKLETAQKLAKTNENVINWLNKQLNDLQSQPRGRPPVAGYFHGQAGSLTSASDLRTTLGSAPSASTPVSSLSTPRLREPPADSAAAPPREQTSSRSDTLGSKGIGTAPAPRGMPPRPPLQDATNTDQPLAARYLQAAKGERPRQPAEPVRIAGLVRRPLPAQ